MSRFAGKAYGKINLGLDVLGVRPDGYHDVKMVMQSLQIADDIEIEVGGKEGGIILSTNLSFLPLNEENLAYKACQMLKEEFKISKEIRIHIEKRIPVAAGMAGGSADAGTVLVGMNQLFQLGLSVEELMKRGKLLGADVPYCILSGTALAEGIGEVLTPLPDMPSCYFVLAKPSIFVSTKEVYQEIDSCLERNPLPIDQIVEGIHKKDLEKITSHLGNVLEKVTIQKYPILQTVKDKLLEYGAKGTLMSGSGPTVFGIFETEEEAKKGKRLLEESHLVEEVYDTGLHQLGRR